MHPRLYVTLHQGTTHASFWWSTRSACHKACPQTSSAGLTSSLSLNERHFCYVLASDLHQLSDSRNASDYRLEHRWLLFCCDYMQQAFSFHVAAEFCHNHSYTAGASAGPAPAGDAAVADQAAESAHYSIDSCCNADYTLIRLLQCRLQTD